MEYLDAQRRVVARGEAAVEGPPVTLTVRWLPWVLRAHPRSRDDDADALRLPICGHRARAGDWIDLSFEHPDENDECSFGPSDLYLRTLPDAGP